jgi:hypothetical protein
MVGSVGWLSAPAQEAGRHADHDRVVRNVGSDHRARPDDGTDSDRDAWEQDGARADVGSPPDHHGADPQVCLDDRHISWKSCVLGSQDPRPGPPAHEVLQHQLAGIEVALGTDPDVVPDSAGSVEPTLEERLRADEDAVTDLERLHVLEPDTGADTNAMAELATRGPPDSTPHERVELSIANGKPRVQLDQSFAAISTAKVKAKADLEVGIRPTFSQTVHCGGQAGSQKRLPR